MEKKETASERGRRINKRGKDNERRFAKEIEETFKYRTRRTPMSGGMHLDFPSDLLIKCPSWSIFENMHIDLKNAANWNVLRWYQEEKELCRKTGTPFKNVIIIAKKPNTSEDFVFMTWKDFKKMLIELEGYRSENV